MAGGGYKDFTTGEVLTATDVQDYLMDQSVMVFGGTAARGSAIASPTEGMVTYLSDTDTLEVYDGTSWSAVGAGAAVLSNTPTGTYSSGGTAYAYYEFTASGTATVTQAGFADVLVVGGGGAGGDSSATFGAGGGGGGGYLAITNAYLPASTLTVVVGAGGSASDGDGRMGITSRLGDYFAVGGGGGTRGADVSGFHGGSGGGGCGTGVGGASTSGQGNTGGNGATNGGGGGGGAGGVGTNATSGNGGAGGSGLASSITGSSVTRAGGGGGGGNSSGGAGGTGGGTAGVVSGTATSAAANTGGGAGGGGGSGAQGGAGGSGVVIVRVRTA